MQDGLKEESERLGETPKHMYHGTGYAGACGIIGVDGRWRFKKEDMAKGQRYVGSMLGDGIYVARVVGKVCPYIGSEAYSYTRYTAKNINTPNNAADGCILICDTVLGNHGEFNDINTAKSSNKNCGGKYDSVAVGAGAFMYGGQKVKEYECCITRQNMIAPRYIVDAGTRRR